MTDDAKLLPAAATLGGLLAVGLAIGGGLVAKAVHDVRASGRHVTVRGLSEREVPANVALWPIVFGATGNELSTLQGALDASAVKIGAFLATRGFDAKEWTASAPRITDFESQPYARANQPAHRYSAEATITVRSGKVAAVMDALKGSGALVRDGVALVNNFQGATYLFTDLESIKPEMIGLATKDARRAAEQFASDSGSRVGAIRSAQQGYFTIEDRDPFSPEFKKLRVVTTVEYFLED